MNELGVAVDLSHAARRTARRLGAAYQLWHRRPTGLSREGRQLVRRMNELGAPSINWTTARRTALDAAEISEEGGDQQSHRLFRTYRLWDQRNVDDDYLRVVAGKGGLIGIYIVDHPALGAGGPGEPFQARTATRNPQATFERVCPAHLEPQS